MNKTLTYFEAYSVAPCPSRDYYGIKVLDREVILYTWRISHGPHLLPIVHVSNYSDFLKDKTLKHDVQFIFGSDVLKFVEYFAAHGPSTLLTLPRKLLLKLTEFLTITDIGKLLCVSKISNRVFDTNEVWEIQYIKLISERELSAMEKDLGQTQGFKKLVKDYQVRKPAKKHLKASNKKPSPLSRVPERCEKIERSASVNIPKIMTKAEEQGVSKKQQVENILRKVKKKSPRTTSTSKEKKMVLPFKSTSEIHLSTCSGNRNVAECQAAGEGYGNLKIPYEAPLKQKNESKHKLSKFEFVNEENERTQLLMHKKCLKSTCMELSNKGSNINELIRLKNLFLVNEKSSKKSSKPTNYKSVELTSTARVDGKNKGEPSKEAKSTKKKSSKLKLKYIIADDKNDDSDESGMSYIMKKYLEASDEVGRKFTEHQRLAHSTKNMSTQVELSESIEEKSINKLAKTIDKSLLQSRAKIPGKAKSLKRV